MKTIFLSFLIIFPITLSAQLFERVYPADSIFEPCESSYGIDIDTALNGMILLSSIESGLVDYCGITFSIGYRISHLQANGDILYSRNVVEPSFAQDGYGKLKANNLDADVDGTFYVAGSTHSDPNDSIHAYLARYDISGNLLWVHTCIFGDYAVGMDVLADSGAVYFTGSYYIPGDGEKLFIQKLDSAGNLLWTHQYTNAITFNYGSLIKVGLQKYFLAGIMQADSGNVNEPWAFYMEFDGLGNTETPQYYCNTNIITNSPGVTVNSQQNLVLISFDAPSGQNLITVTDGNTILNQFQTSGVVGNNLYVGYNIAQMPDENYVIAGNIYYTVQPEDIYYSSGIYLQKVDNLGNILWEKIYTIEYPFIVQALLSLEDSLLFIGTRNHKELPYDWMSSAVVFKTDAQESSQPCSLEFYPGDSQTIVDDPNALPGWIFGINTSFGTGPFTWYVDGIMTSNDLHLAQNTTFSGWHIISLVGCNDSITDSIYVSPTSTQEVEMDAEIILFPNPSNDHITLQVSDIKMHRLRIYSITGAILQEINFSVQTEWDVNEYPPGIYIYNIDNVQYGRFIVSE